MKNCIETLDWFITNRCNEGCGYCYAPLNFCSKVDYNAYLEICRQIKRVGFTTVGICGGEPTEVEALPDIVRALYQEGLRVSLYTNCTRNETVLPLLKYLYSLNISLDSTYHIEGMRNRNHLNNVCELLTMIENGKMFSGILKVGTVVTKKNYSNILDVQNVLERFSIVNVWKLYQYSPGGRGKINRQTYEIEDEKFNLLTKELKSLKMQIIPRSRQDTKGYCVIMDSHGDFYSYNEDYIPTGCNLFNNTREEITKIYNEDVNNVQKKWKVGL